MTSSVPFKVREQPGLAVNTTAHIWVWFCRRLAFAGR